MQAGRALRAGCAAGALIVGCGGAGPAATGPRAGAPAATGPFWYTRTTTAARLPVPLVVPVAGRAPTVSHLVWFRVRQSTETWIGRDGTARIRRIELSRGFASPADRERWLASKQPRLPTATAVDGIVAGDGRLPPALSPGGPDAGDGLFSSAQIASLPTDAGALRRRLEQASAAMQRRAFAALRQAATNAVAGQATRTFQLRTSISGSAMRATTDAAAIVALLATPVPAGVRAALVRVVETLPGVVTKQAGVRDPLGRPGVSVRIGAGRAAELLIVDPRVGVVLADGLGGGSVGRTIVGQGAVGSIRALPAGLRPLPGPVGPGTIAVSPTVGGPATTFSVTVRATAGGGRIPGLVAVSGPGGPRCAASLPRPVTTAPSTGAGGSTYRIGPAVIGRTSWCRGRYEAAGLGSGVYFEVR